MDIWLLHTLPGWKLSSTDTELIVFALRLNAGVGEIHEVSPHADKFQLVFVGKMNACNAIPAYTPGSSGGNAGSEPTGSSGGTPLPGHWYHDSGSDGITLLLRDRDQGGVDTARHGPPVRAAEYDSARRTLFSPIVSVASHAAAAVGRAVGGVGESTQNFVGDNGSGAGLGADRGERDASGALVPLSLLSSDLVEKKPVTATEKAMAAAMEQLLSRCRTAEFNIERMFEERMELLKEITRLNDLLHEQSERHGNTADDEMNKLKSYYEDEIAQFSHDIPKPFPPFGRSTRRS